jgi:putative heme-binding domain-containing protein
MKPVGPMEIDRLLPAYLRSKDSAVGFKLVTALEQCKGAKGLRPEALKTIIAHYDADVQKQAERFLASLNPDAAKQKERLDELLATLPKGDIRRGQIVFNSAKVGCVSCHAVGYIGGQIGPDLTRVGQIRSERDLLESIVYPSASFVQSFEPVMVVAKDGDNQYGIIRKNDAEEIVLVAGPTQTIRMAKSNVKEIRPGTVSIMPQGLDQQLSPQELGDLLAFLKSRQG